jgi:hypothetical protein
LKHISPYLPFDENDYKDFFEKEYTAQLGAITFDEAKVIFHAFKILPKKLVRDLVNRIEFDPSLGKSKHVFPNHGRWEDNFGTMILNRSVIDLEPNESLHLIIHEIGHALDHKLGDMSKTPAWLELSGWTLDPPGITPRQKSDRNYLHHGRYRRLRIEETGLYSVSEWWYNEDADFVRWYAKRNPQEDFCESFAYYVIEEMDRFKGCPLKAEFIKNKVLQNNI